MKILVKGLKVLALISAVMLALMLLETMFCEPKPLKPGVERSLIHRLSD